MTTRRPMYPLVDDIIFVRNLTFSFRNDVYLSFKILSNDFFLLYFGGKNEMELQFRKL